MPLKMRKYETQVTKNTSLNLDKPLDLISNLQEQNKYQEAIKTEDGTFYKTIGSNSLTSQHYKERDNARLKNIKAGVVRWKQVQEEGDMCIPMAYSC